MPGIWAAHALLVVSVQQAQAFGVPLVETASQSDFGSMLSFLLHLFQPWCTSAGHGASCADFVQVHSVVAAWTSASSAAKRYVIPVNGWRKAPQQRLG